MVVTIDSKFYSKLQLGISKYQEKTPADSLKKKFRVSRMFRVSGKTPTRQLIFGGLNGQLMDHRSKRPLDLDEIKP